MLVAMFFLMFYLSTPQIRRTPLFIMNVVAVVLGVVTGFTQVKRTTLMVLYPNTPGDDVSQRIPTAVSVVLPIYVDSILAVRLYIVYPRSMTSSLQLAVIFIPEIALKILRTVSATYYLVRYFQHLDHDPSISKAFAALLYETPCLQIEWIAGLLDNWDSPEDFRSQNSMIEARAINLLAAFVYVFMANFYVQIIGVLLATIWVSKERSAHHSDSAYPASFNSSLSFHAATVDPARTWASENLPPRRTCRIEE
ncbi:hypothetical protein DL96DRAFT_1750099 [Flagelloscypha sp. PMI_526]|nr:hypothetical protein DL96DRAFT_1750099 [Flagelloscypha sp. PMI_526]